MIDGTMRTTLFFLLAIYLAPAHAIEPYSCRNGFFPKHTGNFEFSTVVAKEREKIHFRDDVEACPDKASCMQKAYLVNGDKLLIAQKHENWVCGWYFGKTREFVGWLPAKNIKAITPVKLPSQQDWLGTWKPIAGENEIRIRRATTKGTLAVDGDATWLGGETASGDRVIHVGEFEGTATPSGAGLTIGNPKEEYDCVVNMRLVSGNLIVSDNNQCGGMNVSFSDVYRRK